MTRALIILAVMSCLMLSGCEEYRKNPDFPFPQFNKGGEPEVDCELMRRSKMLKLPPECE